MAAVVPDVNKRWSLEYPDLGTEPVPTEPCISPAYFELERERVFKKVWLYVGRVEEIPNLGDWSTEQLKAASQTSCGVLKGLGPQIEWLHSYVTQNKLYCVYNSPNEEMIREHAKQGGFPANSIEEVKEMIGPETAEG